MSPTLLIVDDEEPILFAMKEYFQNAGFEVDCAARLEEAQALLEQRRHAALIADLRLSTAGRNEGLALVAHAREASPATQIVVLTAYGSAEIEREARRLGVGAFLHKPQPLAQIASIVRGLIGAERHE
jgi:DNA-binding NtrC family response regulator